MAITVTKQIVSQSPLYTQQQDGTLALLKYQDLNAYPWATTDERTVAVTSAKADARGCGGRVISRNVTVDDKDTTDELDNDVTIAEKVLQIAPTGSISVPISKALAPFLISALSSRGEPWATKLAAEIQALL